MWSAAAVAIPKYLDMRMESIKNAAYGAISELNARERLSLAKSKLDDASANTYYSVTQGYDIGADWGGTLSVSTAGNTGGSATVSFKGKSVQLTKTAATNINEPAQWSVTSVY